MEIEYRRGGVGDENHDGQSSVRSLSSLSSPLETVEHSFWVLIQMIDVNNALAVLLLFNCQSSTGAVEVNRYTHI